MTYSTPINPKIFLFTVYAGGEPHEIVFDGTAVTEEEAETSIAVEFNGDNEAVMYMTAGDSREFRSHDIHVRSMRFSSFTSGANDVLFEVIAGVV